MLSYNGKEFKNTINDILHEEILTDIMHDYGTGDEEQFEKHITDIITLIYRYLELLIESKNINRLKEFITLINSKIITFK